MAVTHTSAVDYKDLLTKIKTFAEANGWTIVYDGLNDGEKWQMGLSQGNCHISVGAQLSYSATLDAEESEHDYYTGQYVTDTRICLSLATSLNATPKNYWGHPGQLPSAGPDKTELAYVNDLHGPFSDVWLFTNHTGDYIHCAVLKGDRFTNFSFGNVDVKGMGIPSPAYAGASFYEFWGATSNLYSNSYAPNRSDDGDHRWFLCRRRYDHQVYLQGMMPAAAVSSSHGVTGPFVSKKFPGQFAPSRTKGDAQNDSLNEIGPTSFFAGVKTQPTTGGIALYSAPVIYGPTGGYYSYVGELPDLRLVDVSTLTPGSDVSYAGENWTVFPWKKKGIPENAGGANTPLPEVNTLHYGVAYKKIT